MSGYRKTLFELAAIRERETRARGRQQGRYDHNGLSGIVSGSRLLDASKLTGEKLGNICFGKKWSNRTQVKLIRLARMIADLAGADQVPEEGIVETVRWKRQAAIGQQFHII
ncbi:hypothetical protein [Sporosarcina trichiuri]|uniref:magnesium chelatase subunit ChlI family protein n=1 Tax=Sporosarcina trichiuri TaxID=3056445 RepID=UPI0025B564AF|nr:hypothetical protein [Sporosarcina sp. 0.2-SM1T-5]WJY26446.1 hypothetical protein QWT68_10175 [Sporosarcina sp. 0.2-SM1T-5]